MKGRTSSQMTLFGIVLPNWVTVTNPDGSHAGSNESDGLITKHYGARGELSAITGTDGVTRDLSGNPTSDPYDS